MKKGNNRQNKKKEMTNKKTTNQMIDNKEYIKNKKLNNEKVCPINDEAVNLVLLNFEHDSARTFGKAVMSCSSDDEINKVLHVINKNELFNKNDKNIAYSLLCKLMSCAAKANYGNKMMWQFVVNKLPYLCMCNTGGEKKYINNYEKIMYEYFIKDINKSSILFNLEYLDVQKEKKEKFAMLINECIAKLDFEDQSVKKRLMDWVSGEKTEKRMEVKQEEVKHEEVKQDKEEVTVKGNAIQETIDRENEVVSCNVESTSNKNDKTDDKEINIKKVSSSVDKREDKVVIIEAEKEDIKESEKSKTIRRTKKVKSKAEILRELADQIEDQENASLKKEEKIKSLVEKNMVLESELEGLRKTNTELNQRLSILELNENQKENEIKKLNDELEKRNTIIEVCNRDKENSQKEMLNAIAAELKYDYDDFMDSVDGVMDFSDIEMYKDMCEIYKEKIIQIFEILKKKGIKVGE